MKRIKLPGVLALAAALACAPAASAADDGKAAPKGGDLVARVNGKGIERAEFDRNWPAFLQSKGVPVSHAEKSGKVDELRAELLTLLVDQEIMYQAAVKGGHQAGEEAVKGEMDKVRGRFDSEKALTEALGENGLTVEDYRTFISRRLSVNEFIQNEIAKTVEVSDEDIQTFYEENKEKMARPEQVKARHVLIEVKAEADDETRDAARKRIEEVIAKARGGEDFAELAKKYSEGPSAPQGGDLGTFPRGRMVPPFEKAAFSLKQGEISDPVLTRFGYHAIKVEEKTEASVPTLEEAKEQMRSFLSNSKVSEAVQKRLDALRAAAKIEKLL
jgi:peptidyl-prolyl cis-trans isomerase C